MKRLLVFFIVGLVFLGACSAQNTNIAQRIIGTWVTQYEIKEWVEEWVFNANGTLKMGSDEYKFGITDTKLVFILIGDDETMIYNISMSSDGRTLILERMRNGTSSAIWLIKK